MPLPRLQLFELEDLGWFPSTIRDLATDYLHFMESRFSLHRPVLPLLLIFLQETKTSAVVDLCSGGGGPVLALYESLLSHGMRVRFTLTDKYPNLDAFRHLSSRYPDISHVDHSVDAANVPAGLTGLRTMFNAFHHFPPARAHAVLHCAVQAQQPIAIFEIPERSLLMMLPLLFTPVFVALATPFIRPFQAKRLIWTYLIPLIPLTCWWDGLVSQWRAYTTVELLELTRSLDEYHWRASRVPIGGKPGHVTFLLGFPKPSPAKAPPCLPHPPQSYPPGTTSDSPPRSSS